MRCRRARTAIVERRLGLLAATCDHELAAHLETCASCGSEAREEATLARRLASLRQITAPPIDVTARVMREVQTLGAPRREVSAAHAAWAALLWGALASTALTAGLPGLLVTLPGAVPELVRTTGALASAGTALAAGIVAPLRVLFRIGLGALSTESSLFEALALLGRGVTLGAILLMSAITALVLARDLGRRSAAPGG